MYSENVTTGQAVVSAASMSDFRLAPISGLDEQNNANQVRYITSWHEVTMKENFFAGKLKLSEKSSACHGNCPGSTALCFWWKSVDTQACCVTFDCKASDQFIVTFCQTILSWKQRHQWQRDI